VNLPINELQQSFSSAQEGRRSRHAPQDRVTPSRFQYDYLALSTLSRDVQEALEALPPPGGAPVALDLGADRSPYRACLEQRGFRVETLDISADSGADHVGTAEETGLPDAAFDLVLCTQVLEHVARPLAAVREVRRILRPEGHFVFSVPHVWFYHPHPSDFWRFTQEGVVEICRQGGFRAVALRSQGGTLLSAAQIANFIAYGVMGKAGAPLYWGINALAEALDRRISNPLFCHNFVCTAAAAH
jgi:SAM-dependent methyltransferase